MKNHGRLELWIEWKSWALPLRIGVWKGLVDFEVQVGPFGITWLRDSGVEK